MGVFRGTAMQHKDDQLHYVYRPGILVMRLSRDRDPVCPTIACVYDQFYKRFGGECVAYRYKTWEHTHTQQQQTQQLYVLLCTLTSNESFPRRNVTWLICNNSMSFAQHQPYLDVDPSTNLGDLHPLEIKLQLTNLWKFEEVRERQCVYNSPPGTRFHSLDVDR